MSAERPPVDVAVGVLIRGDGQVLLAQRPEGKPYAGWWEFAGGKLEPGETVQDALARELDEELGLSLHQAHPWVTLGYVYPHATVRLHFCRCFAWQGEPTGREGQAFTWTTPGRSNVSPLLPATVPAMKWLQLPAEYAISDAAGLGPDVFLQRLEARLQAGLRWVQLREPRLSATDFDALFAQVLERVRACGATLIVNSVHPPAYWQRADGVQLRSADWHTLQERPGTAWVGASCHTQEDLEQAAVLGCDFAVLGAVGETPTHPDRPPLGWAGFADAARSNALPVYAVGGLSRADLENAYRHRAHGIASIRSAWS